MSAGTASESPGRLLLTDALRGVAAVFVLAHHVGYWLKIPWGNLANSLSLKSGLYAVECFFALSGLSLVWAYYSPNRTFSPIAFLMRRAFRIAPLYYSASVSMAVLAQVGAVSPAHGAPSRLAANASLLFGLWDPTISNVLGGWSIGVEVVFYLLFPGLIRLGRSLGFLTVAASGLSLSIAYSFLLLDGTYRLENQWQIYVNPVNHLGFFCTGMAIGASLRRGHRNLGYAIAAICLGAVAVIAWNPLEPKGENFVSGLDRCVLSAGVLLIVWGVAHLDLQVVPPGPFKRFCRVLGDSSYCVYILHPFAYAVLKRCPYDLGPYTILLATGAITLLAALIIHPAERYFINLGKKLATGNIATGSPR